MKIISNGRLNIYGLCRLFRAGNDVVIKPTLNCNLACWYCAAEMAGTACWVNPGKEMSCFDWLCILEKHEQKYGKIRQVGISGGEPFMYKDILILLNALTAKGYLVYICSNLLLRRGLELSKSNKIKISSTYHGIKKEVFERNLKDYSKKFFVISQELDETWTKDSNFNLRKLKLAEEANQRFVDTYGPDGTFYKKDEKPNKKKYDEWRNECIGQVANPHREKL